jgi:hypothetical protein
MRRWLAAVATATALLVFAGFSGGASAGAGDPASCMGQLGSNEPAAGARAEDAHAIKALASEIGIPAGFISAGFAQQEACEE